MFLAHISLIRAFERVGIGIVGLWDVDGASNDPILPLLCENPGVS